MSGYLIDLLFSFSGRASRVEWLLGTAAIGAAGLAGVWLFNDASFDESLHADAAVPTMAAVLWALLCLYAFAALSAKRLAEAGYGLGRVLALAAPVSLLVGGWSSGYFTAPLSLRMMETQVFWLLAVLAVPTLLVCARAREVERDHGA